MTENDKKWLTLSENYSNIVLSKGDKKGMIKMKKKRKLKNWAVYTMFYAVIIIGLIVMSIH